MEQYNLNSVQFPIQWVNMSAPSDSINAGKKIIQSFLNKDFIKTLFIAGSKVTVDIEKVSEGIQTEDHKHSKQQVFTFRLFVPIVGY